MSKPRFRSPDHTGGRIVNRACRSLSLCSSRGAAEEEEQAADFYLCPNRSGEDGAKEQTTYCDWVIHCFLKAKQPQFTTEFFFYCPHASDEECAHDPGGSRSVEVCTDASPPEGRGLESGGGGGSVSLHRVYAEFGISCVWQL